ncbi:hypothetical protein [Shimia thalassica]|uniref:hypothetical protein n=1 Tax=Shimia thalassica TaxID=1715693 RepID=UPI0026E3C5A9|nr:hypothetical protein [Shimia thalassica]MDO6483568.1 hypothetical protein [Shimia thalassica]
MARRAQKRTVQHNQDDRSAITAPRDVAGVELLEKYGLDAYDALYRSRQKWTLGDLILIAQAAGALEQITQANAELKAGGLIVNTKYTSKPNPLISTIELLRNRVANALRDAGLRTKDGQLFAGAAADTHDTPTETAAGQKTGAAFDVNSLLQ